MRQAWEEHCRAYGRGIFDPRHSAEYLENFIWAAEYSQAQKKAGRKGETQAGRNDRKWLSRVVEVEKLLKDADWNSWHYQQWREHCNGSSLDPRSYDVRFLKQVTDELQRASQLGKFYPL